MGKSGKYSGKFIVLDGPDGCGKSTQTKLLVQWLSKQGVEVEVFRDPGTTQIGEKIREILLDTAHKGMSTRTELLLYMAARSQLWTEKIKPALQQHKCVILDRWVSSTCAYQGFAGGFGVDEVIAIAGDCLERVWPDLTIILDVDAETASSRLGKNLDRMEQKGKEYHSKVRQGFWEMAEKKENVVVVDGSGEVDNVHKAVISALAGMGFA